MHSADDVDFVTLTWRNDPHFHIRDMHTYPRVHTYIGQLTCNAWSTHTHCLHTLGILSTLFVFYYSPSRCPRAL